MHLPREPVDIVLRLRTQVIHSFFVTQFRVKQDLISGFPTSQVKFTPTKQRQVRDRLRGAVRPGPLQACAATRSAWTNREEYDKWLSEQIEDLVRTERCTRRTPSFIGKYIFSFDHKVIGIQYIITAMFMGHGRAARSRS